METRLTIQSLLSLSLSSLSLSLSDDSVFDAQSHTLPRISISLLDDVLGLDHARYYDNTIFHRVIKGFMVQGGDPTGTGNVRFWECLAQLLFDMMRAVCHNLVLAQQM